MRSTRTVSGVSISRTHSIVRSSPPAPPSSWARANPPKPIASRTVEKIVLPTNDNGQPAPALRWGDPRTVALFAALCGFITTPACRIKLPVPFTVSIGTSLADPHAPQPLEALLHDADVEMYREKAAGAA